VKKIFPIRLLILFFLISGYGFSQSAGTVKMSPFAKRWYLGINLGPDFYYGDLRTKSFLPNKNVSLAGSLFLQYHFNDIFGLRIQLLPGGLNGSKMVEKEGKTIEESFTGIFIEANVNGTVNFFNLFSPGKPERRFFIYGTVGVGYSGWYSKLLNKVYNYDSLSTDNPLKNFHSSLVLPVGVGAIFKISEKIQANVEWTWRSYLSDQLDNTIGGYKFDMVDYLAVGISLRVGGKGKHQKENLNVLDYRYPVYPVTYQQPEPVRTPQAEPPVPVQQSYTQEEYDYVVQIFAFDKHNYSAEWIRKRYKIGREVRREQEGTLSRYFVGNFRDIQSAKALRDEMLQKGIHDAFIVAYKNGVRHHTVIAE